METASRDRARAWGPQLRYIRDGGFEAAVELGYAPLYLLRVRGGLTYAAVDAIHDLLLELAEQALDEGRGGIAYVTHMNGLRQGEAGARNYYSTRATELRRSIHGELNRGEWCVVSSAVVRGTLQAISWLTSRERDTHFRGSWQQAVAEACEALERCGEAVESGAERYRFPANSPPAT